MTLKKFFFSYYRSIIVFAVILAASIIPASEVQMVHLFSLPNFDKLIHTGMYFTFSFVLIYDGFKVKPGLSRKNIYLVSAFTAVLYGGILEIFQSILTRSRSGDWFDFLADALGVVVALGIWSVLKKPR